MLRSLSFVAVAVAVAAAAVRDATAAAKEVPRTRNVAAVDKATAARAGRRLRIDRESL